MGKYAHVDVVLVAALPVEREALRLELESPQTIQNENRIYDKGRIGCHDVVLLPLFGMGNVKAAAATTEAIRIWNPRQIILGGIAGGVQKAKERCLGDVLVADQIVDYELGKLKPESLERRYNVYRPSKLLLDAGKAISNSWANSVREQRPDGTTGRILPQAHFGTVASGQKVVTNLEFLNDLQKEWVELIGMEMEGAGVAAAVYESQTTAGLLLAKGVSDWADPAKTDGWQRYAAATSAAFIASLLRATSFIPVSVEPSTMENPNKSLAGEAKIIFNQRMSNDWPELADYFRIPPNHRKKFDRGREAAGVWEWLEDRGKLGEINVGLKSIGRDDLIGELSQNPQ
jgi:nucleoside phosphorylase